MPDIRLVPTAAPLRQQVIEWLRDAISDGRFRPGQRLVERELCESIGVSRTSVREALRQLEAEGLVTMIANKGPIVSRINTKEARNIYAVRAVLEGVCVQQFATRASQEQIQELSRIADILVDLAQQSCDVGRFLTVKKQFYQVLFEGADNSLASGMIRAIHARASLLRATTLSQPGRIMASALETRRIAEHLARRDAAAAWDETMRYIGHAAQLAMIVLGEEKENDTKTSLESIGLA